MDRKTCEQRFGATNVLRVRRFNINTRHVDFGDHPHLVGAPQGMAVVCWLRDGRIAVKGFLFADNIRHPYVGMIEIRFQDTNGQWTRVWKMSLANYDLAGLIPPTVVWKEIEKVSPHGKFNLVRIRLMEAYLDTGLEGADLAVGVVATRSYSITR